MVHKDRSPVGSTTNYQMRVDQDEEQKVIRTLDSAFERKQACKNRAEKVGNMLCTYGLEVSFHLMDLLGSKRSLAIHEAKRSSNIVKLLSTQRHCSIPCSG